MRRLLWAVAAATLVAGCSSSKPPSAAVGPGSTTTAVASGPIAWRVKDVQFEALAAPSQADRDAAQAGVLTTMQTYLKQAILGPLQSGAPAGDVAALFSPNAIARATSAPDRSALFDEGLPAITDLRAEDATMNLTGLVGADAKVVVMTATFSLKINGSTSGTPVAVQRSGDLVLVPDGGLWKIDAYDIRATRDTPAGTTTTAAAKK